MNSQSLENHPSIQYIDETNNNTIIQDENGGITSSTHLNKLSAGEISKEAKSYLKEREERHLRSISKEVIVHSLKKFGKDILKDETFYEDLPEIATKKLSSVFMNNTYLMDSSTGSKTARILENLQDG